MRINNVDFPGPLFEAQKSGALVVFAGAGVSIPPPSNLPNFDRLAEQVAAGVLNREKDEPVDRFLGRLKDRHIEVHDLVRRILSDPASKPNTLHTDLLRLFESPTKVRLVTTNFDLHFTSAATGVFSNSSDFLAKREVECLNTRIKKFDLKKSGPLLGPFAG
jgi:NAD-dependent SIR2 family protein deacetylase